MSILRNSFCNFQWCNKVLYTNKAILLLIKHKKLTNLWPSALWCQVNNYDYEVPDQEKGDDGYICAMIVPQTAEQEDNKKHFERFLKPPAHAFNVKPQPQRQREAKTKDSHSRGSWKATVHQETQYALWTELVFVF